MKQLKSNKGFTLVELIIVIAILAIIMLIAIPNFSGIQQRMQVRADKSSAAQIGKAIRIWYTEYTSDAAFATAVTNTVAAGAFETTGDDVVGKLKEAGSGSTAGRLPKLGDTSAKPAPINLITKLDEYVDVNLKPKSLRADTSGIVEEYQYYFACIVGSGTAEKVVVCIADDTIPAIAAPADATVGYTVGYTGDPGADTFEKTIAYIEP